MTPDTTTTTPISPIAPGLASPRFPAPLRDREPRRGPRARGTTRTRGGEGAEVQDSLRRAGDETERRRHRTRMIRARPVHPPQAGSLQSPAPNADTHRVLTRLSQFAIGAALITIASTCTPNRPGGTGAEGRRLPGAPCEQRVEHRHLEGAGRRRAPRSTSRRSTDRARPRLHPDFGSNPAYGIPYLVVPEHTTRRAINYTDYGDESDPGPFPIPPTAPVEGGASSTGDRHVLVVEQGIVSSLRARSRVLAHATTGTRASASTGI